MSANEAAALGTAAMPGWVATAAGWQPIETAPRNFGEKLLLWRTCKNVEDGFAAIGYAMHGPEWHCNECRGEKTLEDYGYTVTHWMPLPPPPNAELTGVAADEVKHG